MFLPWSEEFAVCGGCICGGCVCQGGEAAGGRGQYGDGIVGAGTGAAVADFKLSSIAVGKDAAFDAAHLLAEALTRVSGGAGDDVCFADGCGYFQDAVYGVGFAGGGLVGGYVYYCFCEGVCHGVACVQVYLAGAEGVHEAGPDGDVGGDFVVLKAGDSGGGGGVLGAAGAHPPRDE